MQRVKKYIRQGNALIMSYFAKESKEKDSSQPHTDKRRRVGQIKAWEPWINIQQAENKTTDRYLCSLGKASLRENLNGNARQEFRLVAQTPISLTQSAEILTSTTNTIILIVMTQIVLVDERDWKIDKEGKFKELHQGGSSSTSEERKEPGNAWPINDKSSGTINMIVREEAK